MCLVCERIDAIKNNVNPYFICELETSYVVLADSQFYRGYTLLLSKYHKRELHQLDANIKLQYLEEMSIVAEAVFNVFKPFKINYELLGNKHPHLHWHIIPRYEDDDVLSQPIWVQDAVIRNHTTLPEIEFKTLKNQLKQEILLYFR